VAVQAVLTEVLTNRQLQQRLHEAAQGPPAPEDAAGNRKGLLGRAWEATAARLRQACRSARAAGVLVGGAVAGALYLARSWVAKGARTVWGWGAGLLRGAGSALARRLPALAWCGT
jgi:hypothetical protein